MVRNYAELKMDSIGNLREENGKENASPNKARTLTVQDANSNQILQSTLNVLPLIENAIEKREKPNTKTHKNQHKVKEKREPSLGNTINVENKVIKTKSKQLRKSSLQQIQPIQSSQATEKQSYDLSIQPCEQEPSIRPKKQQTSVQSSQAIEQRPPYDQSTPPCEQEPSIRPKKQQSSVSASQTVEQQQTGPSTQCEQKPSIRPKKQQLLVSASQTVEQQPADPFTQCEQKPSIQPKKQQLSVSASQTVEQQPADPSTQCKQKPSIWPKKQQSSVSASQPTDPSTQCEQKPSIRPKKQRLSVSDSQTVEQQPTDPSTQCEQKPSIRPKKQRSSVFDSQTVEQQPTDPSTQCEQKPSIRPKKQRSSVPASQTVEQQPTDPSTQCEQKPSIRPKKQRLSVPASQTVEQQPTDPSTQYEQKPSIWPKKQRSSVQSSQATEPQPTAQKRKPPVNVAPQKSVQVVTCVEERIVVDTYHIKQVKLGSEKKSRKKRKVKGQSHDEPSQKKARLEENEDYEIESIVAHEVIGCEHFYEVKWKGWSLNSNTWEPSDHLNNCEVALLSFLKASTEEVPFDKEEFEKLKAKLSFEQSELNEALKPYKSPSGIIIPPPDDEIETFLECFSKVPQQSRDPMIFGILKEKLLSTELFRLREKQLQAIQAWELRLNETISQQAGSLLKVENNEDLEFPPENFTYVNEYVPGRGVVIPDDPPTGCLCAPSCNGRRCCNKLNGNWSFAYTQTKLLKVPLGAPVFECNKKCKCGPDCNNRVVQNGRKFSLCIFRTSNNCGWGVKTLEHIPKGSFVTKYVGELITTAEGDRRGKTYDEINLTYLFDLDFNGDPKYCVDAAIMGNESHFVNHSCDPNMFVFSVWDNCLDPDIPNIAFFSIKDIPAGSELYIDYLNEKKYNTKKAFVNPNPRNENMICKCGAKNCRKYYL